MSIITHEHEFDKFMGNLILSYFILHELFILLPIYIFIYVYIHIYTNFILSY